MILREAYEEVISVLGPDGVGVINSELKSRCDYHQEYLEIKLVAECLESLFGAATAGLLIQRIKLAEKRSRASQTPNAISMDSGQD